jgi:predicted RecB family endonuclease
VPDPFGIRAMFKEMNIHTLAAKVDTLSAEFATSKNDVRILQDWCQQSLDDLEERTATAFEKSVDMIGKVEERVDEIEQEQEDQKKEVGRHSDDIQALKEAIK